MCAWPSVWDIRSGQCVETLKGHSGTVFCMWADGGHVVSGDSNDWLFVWDLRQRRRLQSFKEHEGVVPTHHPLHAA